MLIYYNNIKNNYFFTLLSAIFNIIYFKIYTIFDIFNYKLSILKSYFYLRVIFNTNTFYNKYNFFEI